MTYVYDAATNSSDSTFIAGAPSSAAQEPSYTTCALSTGVLSVRRSGFVAADIVPGGFSGADEFGRFGSQLHGGLTKAGFSDTRAAFQGSSVTGVSWRTGVPFDIGRVSDYDIALAGDNIFGAARDAGIGLRSGGIRTGPLNAADLEQLGLTGLRADLSDVAGRDVNFMIFRNMEAAFARGPSIEVPLP